MDDPTSRTKSHFVVPKLGIRVWSDLKSYVTYQNWWFTRPNPTKVALRRNWGWQIRCCQRNLVELGEPRRWWVDKQVDLPHRTGSLEFQIFVNPR